LEVKIASRIERGIVAVTALEALRKDPKNAEKLAYFKAVQADLGYGLLLKKYISDVRLATPEMKARALRDAFPKVTPMFWTFRIMVAVAFAMLALIAVAFWSAARNRRVSSMVVEMGSMECAVAVDCLRNGMVCC
jgi:cytochrome d ubiquinol oxidase subunit I